jgi:hypothetical protein
LIKIVILDATPDSVKNGVDEPLRAQDWWGESLPRRRLGKRFRSEIGAAERNVHNAYEPPSRRIAQPHGSARFKDQQP